jgi:hypothetical protein
MSKLEASKADGVHHQLNRLAGEWEGIAKVWFEPDTVQDESPVKATMKPILDGRFILHEYKGSFGGKPLEGVAIYGYHLDLKRIQAAWVDSFHCGTAIMFSQGKRGESSLNMAGSYTYISPEKEVEWGWRTEIEIISDDEVRFTAYNVEPDGQEQKATEVIYKRVK